MSSEAITTKLDQTGFVAEIVGYLLLILPKYPMTPAPMVRAGPLRWPAAL